MIPNDEVRRLRRDLDEIQNRTEDFSRRLGKLEALYATEGLAAETARPSPAASIPLKYKSPNETLHYAARHGDIASAERSLDEGADINTVIGYDNPLDVAVEAGQFEMVRFLVANGARIDHDFLIGKSHIRRAKALGRDDIAEFLERTRNGQPEPALVSTPAMESKPRPVSVPEPDLWGTFANAPGVRQIREHIEEVRKRTREVGWEVQLGTYWLPRIAVLCIAIAVVFFLSLAINRWGAQWLPHLRVGIGYAVCAGLLAMAWRSESKYNGLARVLYGGGFAVMYFVTFATHYVAFARIFASPVVTLILLALIVIAWGIAAQVRQSKVIAVLVTALGHLTIMLSTLTLTRAAPFSVMGIVFLSAGSAFFLLRNRWYYVATLGMLFSYANDVLVLAHSRGGNPYTDFAGSMGVLSVFLLIYMFAEFFASRQVRESVPTWFRTFFVTVNIAAFTLVGTIIMNNFDFTRTHMDWFRFGVAALLALMALAYLRLRAGDPVHNAYFTIATVMFTLGLAEHYNGGPSFAAWLAVEMIALLVTARRTGLVVMRLLAFGAGCLAFQQALDAAIPVAYAAPEYSAHVVKAAIAVLAFLVSSQLYQLTDWTLRSPQSAPFKPETLSLLWKLDLLSEHPQPSGNIRKPLEGLLFPYLYSFAGTVLVVSYVLHLVQDGHRFAIMAGFAFAMTVAAALLESKPFGLAGTASLALVALAFGLGEFIRPYKVELWAVVPGIIAAAGTALASEESRIGRRTGLAFHQNKVSPYLLYGVCAWLTGLLLVKEFPGVNGAFALAVAAVLSAALFLVLHATAFACITGVLTLWASIIFLPEVTGKLSADPARFAAAAVVLVGLSLIADRYFSLFKKRSTVAPYLCAGFVVNAALLLLSYFEVRIPQAWLMTATALVCYGFLAYALVFRSTAAAAVSIIGVLYASLRHTSAAFDATSLQPGTVEAFVLLAVFWVALERLYVRLLPRFDESLRAIKTNYGIELEGLANAFIPIAPATILLIAMIDRLPHLTNANLALITIGWFALAAGLFATAFVFRQHLYRYAGLGVILLSLGRLFLVDMKEQDPLLRVAAFAVVGGGLLCISVGYYKWMARTRDTKASESDASSEQSQGHT